MKTAEIWEQIFDKYHIIENIEKNGFFEITSKQIDEFHQARLMAKYDFSNLRPKVFKEHQLGILPTNRGKYIIGKFKLYKKLETIEKDPEVLTLPAHLETIDPDNIYSEANALHVGLLTGMLDRCVGEPLVQSISGRMSTNGFEFEVAIDDSGKTAHIVVDKPQIEIDGGYEGKDCVVLVEAKNKQSSDFIVRQLYYPYRYWKEKVTKEVVPVFFLYDSGVYTVYKYAFRDKQYYNSLELVEAKNYIIKYDNAEKQLSLILKKTKIVKEKDNIPFPQANSFTKVINMLTIIYEEGAKNAKEVAELLEVVDRQGNYYVSAGIYLDLIKQSQIKGRYELTEFGKRTMMQEVHIRNRMLCESILKHKVYNLTLKDYYNDNKLPSKERIEYYISNYSNLSKRSKDETKLPDTLSRRFSTVQCWMKWMLNSQL